MGYKALEDLRRFIEGLPLTDEDEFKKKSEAIYEKLKQHIEWEERLIAEGKRTERFLTELE